MLACTAGATLAARKCVWPLAGALAGLASISRPEGALVLIILVVEYLSACGDSFSRPDFQALARLSLPTVTALATYGLFSARVFGSPVAFLFAQEAYRGQVSWPWLPFLRLWNGSPALHGYDNLMYDASLAILAIVSLPMAFRQLRLSYGLYALASVVLPLTTSLVSFSRILLGAFPCFMVLALGTRRRAVFVPVVLSCALLLGLFTVMFTRWQWVA
jgi:hypothetical protein